MAIAAHHVARTRGAERSLEHPERADWLWHKLQQTHSAALSCVLMPDHVHLVTDVDEAPRFRHIMTGFTCRYGVRFDVPSPEVANTTAIAARMVRYGFLNPLRAGLVDDPWSWPWSTLRDLTGATHPVWTPLTRVAAALRLSPSAVLERLTAHGDAGPAPPRRDLVAAASFAALREAAFAALRVTNMTGLAGSCARRLIVQMAYAIGSPRPQELAKSLGCSVRSVHRHKSPRHPALDAALVCLADPRLRNHALPIPDKSRGPFRRGAH